MKSTHPIIKKQGCDNTPKIIQRPAIILGVSIKVLEHSDSCSTIAFFNVPPFSLKSNLMKNTLTREETNIPLQFRCL